MEFNILLSNVELSLQNHKSRGQRSQIAVVTEAEEIRREGPCREADVSSEESDPKDTRTEEPDHSGEERTATTTPADAEAMFSLPTTPGGSPLTAGHYMIAEDQIIVSGSVPNVVDALMLMFAAYYLSVIAQNWELPWSSCRDLLRYCPV
ncbi:hypothetical protein NQZ68_005058 [Dissostichus eleginoides]|nr:hypothetical protein NQZ68_005058 [Dissostichus eleginoides]